MVAMTHGCLPGACLYLGCDSLRRRFLLYELQVFVEESPAVMADRHVIDCEVDDFSGRVRAGFLFFRRRARAATCSMILLVQGGRLFGVGWRLRVGRGGTGGSVIWRPTPGEGKRALLGDKKCFQLAAPEGTLCRRGVQEHIAIGGGVTVGADAVENRDQVNVVQNLQILFHGGPAQV